MIDIQDYPYPALRKREASLDPSLEYDPRYDPKRPLIRAILKQNYLAMILAYSGFTAGWMTLLFTSQKHLGAGIMALSFGSMALYSLWRDRKIRALGFDRDHPYPSDWSQEFHDREPEAFKFFTVIWTFSFLGWAIGG